MTDNEEMPSNPNECQTNRESDHIMDEQNRMGISTNNPDNEDDDGVGTVTKKHIFLIIFGIFTHILDMIVDLSVAGRYLLQKEYHDFTWTISVLFIPSLINVIVSDRMYQQDFELDPESSWNRTTACKIIQKKKYWPLIVFFQFAPVLRYFDNLKCALIIYKCQKGNDYYTKKQYHKMMIKEKQDISLLQIFECFLESAPQAAVQLSLMIRDYKTDAPINFTLIHRIFNISMSLVSMSYVLLKYYEIIRLAQENKENIKTKMQKIVQFLWILFVAVSRIVTIGAAAAIYSVLGVTVCFLHWIFMTIWMIKESSGILQFCRNQSREPHIPPTTLEKIKTYSLCGIYGAISIFIYLKPKDGPTLYRHIVYYTICGLENFGVTLFWIFEESVRAQYPQYWNYIIISFCTVSYIVGVLMMIIYYRFLHPKVKNQRKNTRNIIT
ncbi:XK-related protein 4 [Chelonus insularis]|uniref:XK-related protein 4 n=1 Tax=Chelonus insularis TaxID=460826 RepID=UPI00158DDB5E|nr:XK-related protein 4 [Chelonus insularis]